MITEIINQTKNWQEKSKIGEKPRTQQISITRINQTETNLTVASRLCSLNGVHLFLAPISVDQFSFSFLCYYFF
jgi:hypothetical protein